MIRIYYNRRSDAPFVWSFDYGTQDTEEKIIRWVLHGVYASEGHDDTIPAEDQEHPKVWIQVLDASRIIIEDGVLHAYKY